MHKKCLSGSKQNVFKLALNWFISTCILAFNRQKSMYTCIHKVDTKYMYVCTGQGILTIHEFFGKGNFREMHYHENQG